MEYQSDKENLSENPARTLPQSETINRKRATPKDEADEKANKRSKHNSEEKNRRQNEAKAIMQLSKIVRKQTNGKPESKAASLNDEIMGKRRRLISEDSSPSSVQDALTSVSSIVPDDLSTEFLAQHEDQLKSAIALLRKQCFQADFSLGCCHNEQEFSHRVVDFVSRELLSLIRRTVMSGESNSVLLIGCHGSGKSVLLNRAIKDIAAERGAENDFTHVRLNGLLQTDDRLALTELTRQLQLGNVIGDKVPGSFADNLQFLLDTLKSVMEIMGHDVVELLEKRVKSRFSHRQIHLFSRLDVQGYVSVCRHYLSLPSDFHDAHFARCWNKHVQELLEETSVKGILHRQYHLTSDVCDLIKLLTPVVCCLSPAHPVISVSDFMVAFQIHSADSKSSLLHGISILELCLVIAMKHLSDIYDKEPFNFEMVYSEYLKFARRRSSLEVFCKPVVMKAYEHLLALELIRPVNSASFHIQKEFQLTVLMVHPTQILTALQKYPSCTTEVKHWATNSIA